VSLTAAWRFHIWGEIPEDNPFLRLPPHHRARGKVVQGSEEGLTRSFGSSYEIGRFFGDFRRVYQPGLRNVILLVVGYHEAAGLSFFPHLYVCHDLVGFRLNELLVPDVRLSAASLVDFNITVEGAVGSGACGGGRRRRSFGNWIFEARVGLVGGTD
jgi:hypothetical protein